LAGLEVLARGVAINVCLHRAADYLASLFVFTHKPLVLLLGKWA